MKNVTNTYNGQLARPGPGSSSTCQLKSSKKSVRRFEMSTRRFQPHTLLPHYFKVTNQNKDPQPLFQKINNCNRRSSQKLHANENENGLLSNLPNNKVLGSSSNQHQNTLAISHVNTASGSQHPQRKRKRLSKDYICSYGHDALVAVELDCGDPVELIIDVPESASRKQSLPGDLLTTPSMPNLEPLAKISRPSSQRQEHLQRSNSDLYYELAMFATNHVEALEVGRDTELSNNKKRASACGINGVSCQDSDQKPAKNVKKGAGTGNSRSSCIIATSRPGPCHSKLCLSRLYHYH